MHETGQYQYDCNLTSDVMMMHRSPTRVYCGFESLSLERGGIARVARLVTKVLSNLVDPATICGAIYADQQRDPGFPKGLRPCSQSRVRFALRAIIGRFFADRFLFDTLGMARVISYTGRRPALCFVHGIDVWKSHDPSQRRIETARRVHSLIAISNTTRLRAIETDPTFERLQTCWLATEEDNPPERPISHEKRPRVTIISRIDESYKGHLELIQSWPRVLASVPDAVLTIIGRGPKLVDFQKIASQSSAACRIEFRGFVPESQMPQVWNQTSVFAMPSRGEGFGLVYIEAMRYGIPVIASVHDAGAEINLDGVTGYNVDLDRPDELPDRLIKLLNNPDFAQSMGHAGLQRWQEHFRFRAFADRFRPILERFLRDPE